MPPSSSSFLSLLLLLPGVVAVDFSFFTLGDWGSGKQNQSLVAKTMGVYGQKYQPHFVIALGDNVYEKGVQSPTDPLWGEVYCDVYTDPSLMDIPWFAILGNHDYYGGHPEAQIDYYLQKLDPAQRWYMPDFYYTQRWESVSGDIDTQTQTQTPAARAAVGMVGEGDGKQEGDVSVSVSRKDIIDTETQTEGEKAEGEGDTPPHRHTRHTQTKEDTYSLEMVFIDTVMLADYSYKRALREDVKKGEAPPRALRVYNVEMEEEEEEERETHTHTSTKQQQRNLKKKLAPSSSSTPSPAARTHLKWIEDTLKASTADWLLVAGHFPVYSAGYHGDTPELKKLLKPLLEKYEVDAYMCGHDHNLEYLLDKEEGEGVYYFVSGSGGQDVYDVNTDHPQAKFAVMESGFMAHTFVEGGKKMKVEIVGRDGEVLLTTVLEQRRTRTQAKGGGTVVEVKHP